MKPTHQSCVICDASRRVRDRDCTEAKSPRWSEKFQTLSGYQHSKYKNIYEVPGYEDEPRIFGTESLFGDWGCDVFLLAKDFAPWPRIEERQKANQSDIFRASCECKDGKKVLGLKTNNALVSKYVSKLPEQTRLLYGSACGGLMRLDDNRGALSDWRTIRLEYSQPLIDLTIKSASRLRVIVCLGEQAWDVINRLCGDTVPFKQAREEVISLNYRGIQCYPAWHPSTARNSYFEDGRDSWLPIVEKIKNHLAQPKCP